MCLFSTAGATFIRPLFSHFLEQQFSVGAVFHLPPKELGAPGELLLLCVYARADNFPRESNPRMHTRKETHTGARNQAQPGANYLWGFEVCVGGKAKK